MWGKCFFPNGVNSVQLSADLWSKGGGTTSLITNLRKLH